MDIYHGDFTINIKNDNSEVTNADIASEKLIREELHKHFPTYAILSEETTDDLSRIDNDYCWIVDPLDGTKDYVETDDSNVIVVDAVEVDVPDVQEDKTEHSVNDVQTALFGK